MTDVLIIGAGPAGLTAAIYACRYGLTVTVFEQLAAGGQLATTPEVENYPGFTTISGFELATTMKEQAVQLGAEIKRGEVKAVSLNGNVKSITTAEGIFEGRTIILANGATRRKLGCLGENELAGRGVSYCATCDGAFFKNKPVMIVGGGNTALEDALFLAKASSKVYLVHRRDEMRGMKSLVNAVLANEKTEILYSSQVMAINGEKVVSSATVQKNGGETQDYPVMAVFIAIGTEPTNGFLSGSLPLDESGYIISDESCKTTIDGVFVAGDSRKKPLRQIVTATADGAVSAFNAANYINSL